MGSDRWMLALDANALTYWTEAMSAAPAPPSEPLAEEKLALVRIFFWMPAEASFKLVPTVKAEYEAISDRTKREAHIGWALRQVSEVRPEPDKTLVAERAEELIPFRAGLSDRKIIAECEQAGISALLTCDGKLIDRLRMETRVWLVRPSEFWDRLRIVRGTPAVRLPADDNPLRFCSWWHW